MFYKLNLWPGRVQFILVSLAWMGACDAFILRDARKSLPTVPVSSVYQQTRLFVGIFAFGDEKQ